MRKKKTKLNKSYKYFFSIFFIIGTAILICNEFGLIKLFKLKNKQVQLQTELEQLLLQQGGLREEIDKLQNDEAYVQQIAREKFMMVVPGEKVYRVQNQKEINIK